MAPARALGRRFVFENRDVGIPMLRLEAIDLPRRRGETVLSRKCW
jgi:hypothetical protein